MKSLILKLDKSETEVIHCLNRAILISNSIFLGKINRIKLRDVLFSYLNIDKRTEDKDHRKEYFKSQYSETFQSYYKGIKCYGLKVGDYVYICLENYIENNEERTFKINEIVKNHNENLIKLLEKYLVDISDISKYRKMLKDAKEGKKNGIKILSKKNGMTTYIIEDKTIFPEDFTSSSKVINHRNTLKIKSYLEDNNILKTMQENKIGVFDIVKDKKYVYVTDLLDKEYILIN